MEISQELVSMVVAVITGAGATLFSVRKFIIGNVSEIKHDKAQLELLDYLKDARVNAQAAEEKAKKQLADLQVENTELRAKVAQLETENSLYKSQNTLLNDIVKSLQLSLSQTKQILEEQIGINTDLLFKLQSIEHADSD